MERNDLGFVLKKSIPKAYESMQETLDLKYVCENLYLKLIKIFYVFPKRKVLFYLKFVIKP